MKETKQQLLTPKQIVCRVVSVVVCAFGIASCVASLALQTEEMGTMMASATWFAGLGCVVASSAGYAATCRGRKPSDWNFLVVIVAIGLAVPLFFYEWSHLYIMQIVYVTVIALLIEAVMLIIYRFLLIREDPEA